MAARCVWYCSGVMASDLYCRSNSASCASLPAGNEGGGCNGADGVTGTTVVCGTEGLLPFTATGGVGDWAFNSAILCRSAAWARARASGSVGAGGGVTGGG